MLSESKPTVGENTNVKKICYFAFDVERTGNYFEDDVVFAIGWAYGSEPENVVKGNACLNLHKPPGDLWTDVWRERSYQKSTYLEFWGKHLNVLDDLQNPLRVNLVESEYEMTRCFREAMLNAEK
jgi:hypothetical protein